MRDDSPQAVALLMSFAGPHDGFVSYRPHLNPVTGGALSTIFLLRVLLHWMHGGRRPFVKFIAPPDKPHDDYKEGQSWQEVLGFSRREYEQAVQGCSYRAPSAAAAERVQAVSGLTDPRYLIIYYTDGRHRTWWEVNEPLLVRLVTQVYNTKEWQPFEREKTRRERAPSDPLHKLLMDEWHRETGTLGNAEQQGRYVKQLVQGINRGEYTLDLVRAARAEVLQSDFEYKSYKLVLQKMPTMVLEANGGYGANGQGPHDAGGAGTTRRGQPAPVNGKDQPNAAGGHSGFKGSYE